MSKLPTLVDRTTIDCAPATEEREDSDDHEDFVVLNQLQDTL
ncbi:hypothetical protein OROHE_003634 [Orobanche hederae]